MKKHVSLEGRVRLAYVEQGQRGSPVVVLLHGYTDSSYSFSRLRPFLDPSRYHVFALDQRGHGDSQRPDDGYAMDDLAADVVAFLDAVGAARATLVGHSMGSLVARRTAELRPDRVERLVLMGSSFTFATSETVALLEVVDGLRDPVPTKFAREFQVSTGVDRLPAAFVNHVIQESLKVPAPVWRAALDGTVACDDAADLARITAPTLVLWGANDPYFGREQQDQLVAAIPDARLLVYPDTAHNPHWERPQSVAYDLSSFLGGPAATTRWPVASGVSGPNDSTSHVAPAAS